MGSPSIINESIKNGAKKDYSIEDIAELVVTGAQHEFGTLSHGSSVQISCPDRTSYWMT